jgi:hypothetical protein
MFNKNDLKLFEQKDIKLEQVEWQIEQFKDGIKPIKLARPATPGNGITIIENIKRYIEIYEKSRLQITKFVPASGAASRMFKSLFEFLEKSDKSESQHISNNKEIKSFFEGIHNFAFYDQLNQELIDYGGIDTVIANEKYSIIINKLLNFIGLAYGTLPKGLLKFHKYTSGKNCRTPFEEHLAEGALYARSTNNIVNLHFTVSPEHISSFKNLLNQVADDYEEKYGVKYRIDFSVQKPSTDTIAVNPDNTPFYEADGTLLFRPGGHGALIENLNSIDTDIIFIKNIDNVIKENFIQSTVDYKKLLAGKLIELQKTIFSFIVELKNNADSKTINKALHFIKTELNIEEKCIENSSLDSPFINNIIERLNRPIRVCGVVKNQGEAGGGPFFVIAENGCVSLQIVESSQVDINNPEQAKLLHSSTHFNPVDIVCGVKDFSGNKFDLRKYVDKNTGFISSKSKSGKVLKALELPGLWNGAMAFWNTVFVEVPIETFNPVKTVNDLLGKYHQ